MIRKVRIVLKIINLLGASEMLDHEGLEIHKYVKHVLGAGRECTCSVRDGQDEHLFIFII